MIDETTDNLCLKQLIGKQATQQTKRYTKQQTNNDPIDTTEKKKNKNKRATKQTNEHTKANERSIEPTQAHTYERTNK